MSTVTPHPPLPRQPLGRTFIVAVSLLGVFALVQLIAVLVHFAPLVRQQLAASATREAAPVQNHTPIPDAVAPAPAAQAPGLAADGRQLQVLLTSADAAMRVGDFENAMKVLDEASALQPEDPGVLLRKAAVFEKMDQPEDALLALEGALRVPGLPATTRAQVQRKVDQLSELVGSGGSTRAQTLESGGDDELRENGLQPGASLGITDVRLRDVKVGEKGLRVAVKSRPGSTINGKDVKILVYFYEEQEDGEVMLTDSKVMTQWMTPPIDWAGEDNEPELLEMVYSLPESPGNEAATGRKFHGYTIGIYYKSELQDFRADPGKLAKDFPLPLYLPQGN